jgi:DNA-binding transcriptional regulator LsrR (DeoR family)
VVSAGGARELEASRTVLRGGWLTTLVTTTATATRRVADP